ncbi:hypothetical protein EDB86DRAFT_3100232 [Lactarius hatsudake]|nr:hypothetical protein EDB86DRAFT_3100232 [Lactarius hatsudake]
MFKRVDRRRKRKEEEDELGLDEDEREVLGLNNTDSSESDSDSDSSTSSSAQARSGHNTHSKNKRKRRTSLGSHDESDDDEDSQPTSGDEVVDGEDIVADHLLSIASALKEPIQLIRTHPEAWVCVFCPNKILKHGAMVKVHEASQIHRRRFKRMQELSMDFSPDESIRKLLRSASESRPKVDEGTLSRRAEQRKAKQAKLKERRQRIKEKKAAVKVKKASKETETEVMPRPTDTDETRPSKRLKASSGRVTMRTTSRPSASPQAEVRKRTQAAQRSKKQPRTDDGAMSTATRAKSGGRTSVAR